MSKKVNEARVSDYYKDHWVKTKAREDNARKLLRKVLIRFEEYPSLKNKDLKEEIENFLEKE